MARCCRRAFVVWLPVGGRRTDGRGLHRWPILCWRADLTRWAQGEIRQLEGDDSLLDATGPESGDREKMLDEPTWPTDNLTNTGHGRPSKFQLSGSIFRKFLYNFLELFIHKSNF